VGRVRTDIFSSIHRINSNSGYSLPEAYTGNATLTQITHTVNSTHFELIYRCQDCWVWNQKGAEGSQIPQEVQIIGWAQHNDLPATPIVFHNNGQSQFGIDVAGARNAKYPTWAGTGPTTTTTTTVKPTSTPTSTSTPTPSGTTCNGIPAPTGSYDYIVVGAGAGGIPVADRLSESGKSVLLIEKGPPSLGRFGGTMKPKWLEGTNLTRFDVPGLCNQIWVDSAGVACTDIDQMAGCVLGGGSAVNAALWWNPVPLDWDTNFPAGWKAADIKAATQRVLKRIPGTDTPSMDGKRYKQQAYDVMKKVFVADGWKEVTPNSVPDQKDRVFGHAPFNYENAQRQGPLGTYLVSALTRSNFKLWTNTAVRRVVRTGGKATGVELDGGAGGYCGTVNLKAGGRVILSSGTFGSTKLLYRSGIGPKDQLTVVKNSAQDGASFISESQWINLPVGSNLNDHVNTDLVVRHKSVDFYDFYKAWDGAYPADNAQYLNNRSGILAQSAPNIGPMAWEVIKGADGINRAIQWQARVEGPLSTDNISITISQYLGRGSTSRGALSINGALNIFVSKAPYLQTKEDLAAITTSLKNMQKVIARNPEITWEVPAANVTMEDYLASLPTTPAKRRANHWIGTSKIGTDSGLTGGTSVVDVNTKVYGTGMFSSLFPLQASF
jgi:cellobiose dehydrogenase (acceptor)